MRAVVLVGGFGTRLRPLTYSVPKPMLPVGRRPIIEHVVEHLARHGVDEVVLALGFAPDAFVQAFPDGHCGGVQLTYAVEPEPLDTAGAVGFAARHAGIDDTFVVVNGDVLCEVDITALVAFHHERSAEATLHLIEVDDPSRFGVVPTDEEGRVTAFIEKPRRDEAPCAHVNAGTYVLEPSVVDRIAPMEKTSIERVTFPAMVADNSLFATVIDGYWVDTGTPATYRAANLHRLAADAPTGNACVVDRTASVERSMLGDECVVGAGARVVDSVLLDGARVGPGAVVERSIIGWRTTVGANATLRDCTVGADMVVPDHASHDDERLPR